MCIWIGLCYVSATMFEWYHECSYREFLEQVITKKYDIIFFWNAFDVKTIRILIMVKCYREWPSSEPMTYSFQDVCMQEYL